MPTRCIRKCLPLGRLPPLRLLLRPLLQLASHSLARLLVWIAWPPPSRGLQP